jgi:mono/diheme cytochrome c family protein
MHAILGAARCRRISMFEPRISIDTRRDPVRFTGSSGDIEPQIHHGFISTSPISDDAGEEIMCGFIRCSFKIAASLCMAILAGDRAFALVSTKAPNGDLFVADSTFGAVRVVRVLPGRATPVRDEVFASGLKQPFGVALYPLGPNPRWIYVANSDGVIRFRYRRGALKAMGKPEQIVAGTPTIHRYARDVAFSPDGRRLHFSVGSAQLPNGVTGLRTCEGMTVQPATGELWCIANERDELDGVPHPTPLQPAVYRDEAEQAGNDAAKGRDLYIANCSACHQASGEGIPGVFPPLKGSSVVNKDDAAKHIQVVLDGVRGGRAGGVVYAAPMPAFGGALSDAEIADIIDYERRSWGNHGKPVTAGQVAAERGGPK